MFPRKPSFWTWFCQTATCQPGLSNMPGLSQWTSTSSAEVEGGDPCSGAVESFQRYGMIYLRFCLLPRKKKNHTGSL